MFDTLAPLLHKKRLSRLAHREEEKVKTSREKTTLFLFLFSSLIPSMLCSLKVTATSSISHEHRVSFSLMVANPVEQARKLNSKSSEFKSVLERSAPKYLP